MRAAICHADEQCPDPVGGQCPGHTVRIPDNRQDMASLLVAVEWGYRACEKGDNLQKALDDASRIMAGG